MIFETERLAVRAYAPEDSAFVLDMYSRWEVIRWLGPTPRPLQSVEEATQTIERWRSLGGSDPLLGFWVVTRRGTSQQVGSVMLKLAPLSADTQPLPLSSDHELGWHLHPDYWGQGYATEASAGALRRALDAGIREVVALIHPDNAASKRVAGRLGMEHVGRTGRYYSMEEDLYRAAAPG